MGASGGGVTGAMLDAPCNRSGYRATHAQLHEIGAVVSTSADVNANEFMADVDANELMTDASQ
jgi:hypothetical protein